MREIINKLILTDKTISTMESCTGGGLANEITSYEDASKVLKFSAVTYSNEYKIKMGVDEEIINKYTVYSIQTAHSMASSISLYTNSNYGVGITGKLNKVDTNNPYGEDNIVFVSIFDRDNNLYYDLEIMVNKSSRKENKDVVISKIIDKLHEIL